MSLAAIYDSLWSSMERDFEDQLDSDSFEGFKGNVQDWAGEHESEAVQAVALEIWAQLHEDEPLEEIEPGVGVDTKGILRNRGKFAGLDNIDEQVSQNFSDDALEASIDTLRAELPSRLEIYRQEIRTRAEARRALIAAEGEQRLAQVEEARQRFIEANEVIAEQRGERARILPEFRLPRGRLREGERTTEISTVAPLTAAERAELRRAEKPKRRRDSKGRFVSQ